MTGIGRWALWGLATAAAMGALVALPAPAGATTVSTEAELEAAYADPAETEIVLADDIEVGCGGLFRDAPGSGPVLIDGADHTITQVCPDPPPSVIYVSTPLEVARLTIVAAPAGSDPVVMSTSDPVTLTDVRLVVGATRVGLLASSGTRLLRTAIELEGGGEAISAPFEETDLVIEDSTITGIGVGLTVHPAAPSPDLESVVITGSTFAVSQTAVVAHTGLTIVRSSLRGGTRGVVMGLSGFVTDSTVMLDGSLIDGPFPADSALRVGPQGNVVVQSSTLLAAATDNPQSDGSAPTLDVQGGGLIDLHGSAVSADDGQRACRRGGVLVSSGWNVVEDDSCGTTGTGDRVADPGLVLDPATGTAPPALDGPLVDGVPVAECRTATDQVGGVRPRGPACDVGAIELQVDRPLPPPTTSTPPGPARPAVPVVGPARFTG